MTGRERFFFGVQQFLGWVTAPVIAPLYILGLKIMGYRVRRLAEIRRTCRDLFRDHPGPWIMCANHLTMIDSLLLIYALFSLPAHLLHYRRLPWNLPESDNFQKNPALAVLCYLAKCIPVHRSGTREERLQALARCACLLSRGQVLMIFPEGGRSRTGRVETDNYAYGVGRLLTDCPDARVLCLYLRGDHQENYGCLPRRGESFHLSLRPLPLERKPGGGLREQRRLAAAIIDQLAQMEAEYFDGRTKSLDAALR